MFAICMYEKDQYVACTNDKLQVKARMLVEAFASGGTRGSLQFKIRTMKCENVYIT